MTPRRLQRALTAVFFGGLLASARASGQDNWKWPEKMKNPKAFPEDFPATKLSAVMKGFTRALGVRCTYCHVGEEGKPLGTYDFASDANPNKDRAREMYRMLGDINGHLKKITPSGDRRVNMWCHTCHAGRPRPVTLEEDLGETYRKSGPSAAVARYRDLREKFYGRAGYDFGERSLSAFASDFMEKGDTTGAIAMFDLNAEQFPRSAKNWENLGDACGAAGKKELAAFYYRKSVELDGGNAAAAEKLRKLEAPPR
jgi:tetratricopeptide (TPR) repeat protein